jgi:RNA polymerase sigma factor (TIGR02999 family)
MPPESPGSDPIDVPEISTQDALFTEVYDRLKVLASRQLSKDSPMTLNTTGLVHELYERMARQHWQEGRAPLNFLACAARAMRNIITDRARHRLAQKSGGDWLKVTLTERDGDGEIDGLALDVLLLDDALDKLSQEHRRAARVVELKYYAGMSTEQIGEAMGLTRRTITRDWQFARAFLRTLIEDR